MPAYERSAVMARGYPGFADGRPREEFEGVKKNSASAKNLQILRASLEIRQSVISESLRFNDQSLADLLLR